jgi:hypothetical protein
MIIARMPHLLLAVCAMLGSGCVAYATPSAAVVVDYDYGYRPLYYRGYAVLYDGWGLPMYYVGTLPYYVPRSYVHYDILVGHYQSYHSGYHDWAKHHHRRHYHQYHEGQVRHGGSPRYDRPTRTDDRAPAGPRVYRGDQPRRIKSVRVPRSGAPRSVSPPSAPRTIRPVSPSIRHVAPSVRAR